MNIDMTKLTPETPAPRHDFRRFVLALGHLCADMNQGMLSALIPFFIAAYSYDYTTSAYLVMVSNIIGSVIQPVFGHLADKKSRPSLMTAGIMLAGGGMAVTGFISSFTGLCIAVVISGIGVAMFHPQGAQLVNRTSDETVKATNLGIFSFGGNLGFTLGPLLASGSIALMGLKGTILIIIPSRIFGVAVSAVFKENSHDSDSSPVEVLSDTPAAPQRDMWGAFVKLGMLISCRSIIFSGVNTFLVMYFVDVLGKSENLGSAMLSIYYAVAAFSSLVGGFMADKAGARRTAVISMIILVPSLFVFAASLSPVMSIAMLVPMGIGISVCYSPMVLLGQQYLPNHVGLASGVTLGLSVSVGGITAPVFGKIGDAFGLTTTFFVLAVFSILPLILAALLSKPESA